MKKGWEIKSLGEIADVEYGFTDKSEEEGDYRYVRITDIDSNGELISTEKKYLKHSKEAEGFLIRDKDLLMARTGATFAKVLLYQDFEPSVFASYLIRINFKEKFENKLYWYFTKTKSYWEQANSLASGAAQPHFNGAAVKQVVFSYPKSLPEQQRIVAILDEAFAAIAKAKANAEQNLKNAKELFESYLQGVFENKGEGWEEKTLGEVCELINRGVSPKYLEKNGVIVLNQKCIRDHKISFEQSRFHDGVTKKVSPEKMVKLGDVLINSTGTGTLGRVAQVREELKNVTVDSHVTIVRPIQNLFYIDFFGWALIFIEDEIAKRGEGCGGQTELARSTLKNDFSICFPKSLKEQKVIVQKLDALSTESKKLEAIYYQKINDLEELKKSVLRKAFSGELKINKMVDV